MSTCGPCQKKARLATRAAFRPPDRQRGRYAIDGLLRRGRVPDAEAILLDVLQLLVGGEIAHRLGDEGVRPLGHVLQLDLPVEVRDRKSTRLNSSHVSESRMPSSA